MYKILFFLLAVLFFSCSSDENSYVGKWCISKSVSETGKEELMQNGEHLCFDLFEDSTYLLQEHVRNSIWMDPEGSWSVRKDSLFMDKERWRIISLKAERLILEGNHNTQIVFLRSR